MYQMSQSYTVSHSFSQAPLYSQLEQIASQPIAYNIGHVDSYDMFIPSPLEIATRSEEPSYFGTIESALYAKSISYHQPQIHTEYHFIPDNFLKPGRGTKFVGKADEIQEFIEDAFERICGEKFPEDIKLSVLDEAEFYKIAPHPGTLGLSINRRQQGLLSEIFVRNGSIGRVLLTVGHEIGHVLTRTLSNPHDEEAKAFSFSLAWMDVIQEFNIAGLENALITETPAFNGLHDISFAFVQQLMKCGKSAMQVYGEIIKRHVSFTSNIAG